MRAVDHWLPIILTAVAATACGIKPRPGDPPRTKGRIITAEQVAATDARTIWDALQRTVRYADFTQSGRGTPERIRRRGASTISLTEDMRIYIDRVRVMDLTVLGQMPATDIERIQVLSGVEATTYFGTNSGDGVILIFTKVNG